MRQPLLAGAAAVVAVLGCAAPAAADSLVYLRDHNVWLANPDGSGQYQVTTDGKVEAPYVSPTQADDGTIAVAHINDVRLYKQNGSLIRAFDPPPLKNTYSHVTDGKVSQLAISPDGSKLAYSYVSYEGEGGRSAAQGTTGFVDASGQRLPGNLYNAFPAWVTNTRALTSGGNLWHVNLIDVGAEVETNWLNDNEAELSDPAVTRDGTHLAALRHLFDWRTNTATTSLITYVTVGDVLTGVPQRTATGSCTLGPAAAYALSSPTWSPDNHALAWAEPEGIGVMANAADCSGEQPRTVIPGASAPHWGPAAVNPGPREDVRREEPRRDPPVREEPRRDPPARPLPTAPGKPAVAVPKTLAQLVARGVRITESCGAACTVQATISVDRATARALRLRRTLAVGTASARIGAAGSATVVVKPTAALRRRLARRRAVTLSVRVVVRQSGAAAKTFASKARLKR